MNSNDISHFDIPVEVNRLFDNQSVVISGEPKAVILMGGVAAGKTTLRIQNYSHGYVVIDAAEIFHHLSRDVELDFPNALQEPLEQIGSLITRRALSERRNIVTEVIGANFEHTSELIDALKEFGYKVEIINVTCDVNEAWRRNEARGDNISAYYAEPFQRKWIIESCHKLAKDAARSGKKGINSSFKENIHIPVWFIYWMGNLTTFGKLTFFDGYVYNWWNWIIVVPINEFLAAIWPIYWLIIRPFFGH